MARRPDQEAVQTFISITGVDEPTAIQKLEEYHGNLNEAVNAHFSEGDRDQSQEARLTSHRDDVMDIDDPIPFESLRRPSPLFPFSRELNPFSLLDRDFTRRLFDVGNTSTRSPFVSHPREVREIPIEVKDETGTSARSGGFPNIEDVTETVHEHGPEIRGTVIMADDDDDDYYGSSPSLPLARAVGHGTGGSSTNSGRTGPTIVDVPDYGNDIEEEIIRAAIEASKHDTALSNQQRDLLDVKDPTPLPRLSHPEDAELAHVVSLSLQTAEQEKALRELEEKVGVSEVGKVLATSEELGVSTLNGRQPWLEVGSTSLQDEAEEVEEIPLVRHRRRRVSSGPIDSAKNIEEVEVSPSSSPRQRNNVLNNESNFPSDEWGGISSEEHDEAVMLEAAMFGGIPEGYVYHFPYTPQQLMQNGLSESVGPYSRSIPRPLSPSVAAQRLIREQQDDEYIAALQADREREMMAKEEAEAALAAERHEKEEMRRKLQEEQENERQLAAKEASLPKEPTPDDENAVTLLVRMPDGSRRGRRFLKSDKLQCLFDFIDVGRVVKPGSYRLVRHYPRRAFSDGESTAILHELGLTSKQEALYLELM